MGNYELNEDQERERGGCLTAFLSVTIFLDALGIITSFFSNQLLKLAAHSGAKLPTYPSWYTPVNVAVAILSVIFLVAILKWKKWGTFGYLAMALVGIIITLVINGIGTSSIVGILGALIWPGILIALVKPIWNHME